MTQQNHEPNSAKSQIRQTRIQKLADLADKGVNPYPYVFNKNATLHPLIQTLLKNKYLHNYHDDYLNSISKLLLEAGVIRNKITGHGKEEEKANDVRNDLNDNLVAFILAQTASCIVFLVKNLNY